MPLLTFGKLQQMVSDYLAIPQRELTMKGLYEQQDQDQEEHNLRGVFHTDDKGQYSLYCLKPTPYPVSQRLRLRHSY
jgi:hypothetical protein